MNPHLFLDIVAWGAGIVYGVYTIALFTTPLEREVSRVEILAYFTISLICWAWIIAG